MIETVQRSVLPGDAPPSAVASACRPGQGGRLAVLDGLRLVAALMVVLYHYTYIAGRWPLSGTQVFPRTTYVTVYGRFGVELFFVISGFVICMSAWGRSLGSFFTSRVTRLYPAYWFAVPITVLVTVALGYRRLSLSTLLVNLTMLQAPLGVPNIDQVYWTLWHELHFYLLFAIVVWRGLTYRRVVLFCVFWLIASVMSYTAAQPVLNALIDPAYVPYFVAGVAMYLMYRFQPTILLWGIVGVSYVLAIRFLGPTIDEINNYGTRPLPHLGAMAVITAIFAIMLAIALGWLDWVRGAWLTTAGALTYPLYLIHQNPAYAVIRRVHTWVPKWPLTIGLIIVMLVVAWLVHRFVERPLARRLKRVLTDAIVETSVDRRPLRSG